MIRIVHILSAIFLIVTSAFAQDNWDTTYSTDFSTDPGWSTNDPTNMYWDSDSMDFYVKVDNANERHATIQVPYNGGSFKIEYDAKILQNDYSSGLNFGLYDDDFCYAYDENAVDIEFVNPDEGRGFTLFATNCAANNLPQVANSFVGFTLDVWYHIVIIFDQGGAGTINTRITLRDDTTMLVTAHSLSDVGEFCCNMHNLGVSRACFQLGPPTTIAKIDNVRFFTPKEHFPQGDVNCDGKRNLGDIIYYVNYIFKGGPPPCVAFTSQ